MSILPSTKRREITTTGRRKIWIYGAPFSGKSTFANSFPDPLFLNTDGNLTFLDAPFIHIKDKIEVEGRMTKRTFAWAILKEAIAELERGQNDFKTIVIDLLEDAYEMCRLYMYDELKISHESDNNFKAWDMVTTEYLSTLKRFMNLDYENIILISHEDSSKDLTRKGGDKITAIRPNLREKLCNKIAGMVDIVARVVADGDNRALAFKSDEVVFGGGRLKAATTEIKLGYADFLEVYGAASVAAKEGGARPAAPKATKAAQKAEIESIIEDTTPRLEPEAETAQATEEPAPEAAPLRRKRRA